MEAISVLTGLIVFIAVTAVIYVVANVANIKKDNPWWRVREPQKRYMVIRVVDYDDGERFVELKQIHPALLPTRMVTPEDYKESMRQVELAREMSSLSKRLKEIA